MSNSSNPPEHECDSASGCGAIKLIIRPREKDLGEFKVRRSLPAKECKMVGPWIFFDHMGPASFAAGEGVNVRPHPHINLATVTYLFDGEILHRDSLGSLQPIRPGDINLMVAGSGITHSERERPEVHARAHSVHGLQLWLALPVELEEVDAAFHHYPAATIPELEIDAVAVRVMMGSAYGVTSPVATFAETLYVEANLAAGQSLLLPEAEERAIYVASGSLTMQGTQIDEHCMAVLDSNPDLVIEATADARIAIIGGENIGPRFIDWNFVSSRKERIEQARQDWKAQRFGKVIGDEDEFIPLPE